MNLDGLFVAGGIVAFFALMVFATTPGAPSKWFDRVLRLVFSYRDIYKPEGLYLRRFFVTPRSWLGYDQVRGRSRWPRLLGWVPRKYRKIFIHHILLSDDRVPHDHPWDFTTLILAGCYVERIGRRSHFARTGTAGSRFHNAAGHIHYLEIVDPVWSLVFAGESRRVWGFWTHDGWQDWRTYLGGPCAPTEPEDQIDPKRYPNAEAIDRKIQQHFYGVEADRRGWARRITAEEASLQKLVSLGLIVPVEEPIPEPVDTDDEPTTKIEIAAVLDDGMFKAVKDETAQPMVRTKSGWVPLFPTDTTKKES